jgi:hemerythrin superfamily protein
VTARALANLEFEDRMEVVERTAAFIAEMLLPHAAAEERVLYPGAAKLLGEECDSEACASDRVAVRNLLGDLAITDCEDVGALQELLFALYTILSAHMWREEQVYVQLAARTSDAKMGELLDEVAQAQRRRGRFRRSGDGVTASP